MHLWKRLSWMFFTISRMLVMGPSVINLRTFLRKDQRWGKWVNKNNVFSERYRLLPYIDFASFDDTSKKFASIIIIIRIKNQESKIKRIWTRKLYTKICLLKVCGEFRRNNQRLISDDSASHWHLITYFQQA